MSDEASTTPGEVKRMAPDAATPAVPGHDAPTQDATQAFAPAAAATPAVATPAATTPVSNRGAIADLAAGTLVGKYRIIEAINGGGMGFVYRALNPDLRCEVALKVIRGELSRPDDVRRFNLEWQALARFRHPNIVAVHDAGHFLGRAFLVMEYLPGGNLAQHKQRLKNDPRAAVALVEKVARAVQQLHAEGILHRDLKPGNVLLDESGEPRVGDFGLVKLLDSDHELTRNGNQPGTPAYMAPEQTELAAGPLGPPTDVWALGVILYELLLGRRPFAADNKAALFRLIARADATPPRELHPGFDAELDAVLLKCLHKDPAGRFATAGELADELGRWLRGEPTHTRPERRLQRVTRALRRRPWTTALVLLAGLALVATPVALILFDPDRAEKAIRDELRRGQPVILIGEAGAPAWSEAAVGTPVVGTDDAGYFTLQAWDTLLLVLVRTPPCAEYRVRAKVRTDRGDAGTTAGLFVGYHATPCPHGKTHLFQALTFNDLLDPALFGNVGPADAKGNPAELTSWLVADIGELRPRTGHTTHAHVRFNPTPRSKTWRRLEIVVRADRMEGSFDGKPLPATGLAAAQAHLRTLLTGQAKFAPAREGFLADVDPAFDRKGAIGLFVAGAMAAFADVVIEPLSPLHPLPGEP